MNTPEVLARIDQTRDAIAQIVGGEGAWLLDKQARGAQTPTSDAEQLTELAIIDQLAALRDMLSDEVHVRLVGASEHVSANRLSQAARISNSTASKWIAADRADLP